MADLVARGNDPQYHWRRTIPTEPVTLGRSAAKSAWDVPWDPRISKLHATLAWRDGRLSVRKEPDALNKIYFQGIPTDEFTANVGEQFVIGETTFILHDSKPLSGDVGLNPPTELTCSRHELRLVKYADAAERIEILAALPAMIRYSPREEDLNNRIVDGLLQGVPSADAAAVVRLAASSTQATPVVEVHYAKCRGQTPDAFQPSRRLIFDAINRRRQSVMHIWQHGEARPDFTINAAFDWAICAPLPDDPTPGWALYVAGRLQARIIGADGLSQQDRLKSDLKFAELVADILGSLRQVQDLQRRQAVLGGFLSRQVLAALAEKDMEEVLQPRETQVTVLFCDLRGSCRIAEEGQKELPALWDRVSEALRVMTSNITEQDGVIGDFQGDAAMGFWGWPFARDDQVEQAVRAALNIRRHFVHVARDKDNVLAGFACGIGIAHGQAIAGRLGTLDQFKVGVFGPVVNLAARLESMTKLFGVPILLDEASAVRLASVSCGHLARLRRLAHVRPKGMQTVIRVSELLPLAIEPGALSDRDRRDYEAALDAFLAGQWPNARDLLRRLPADGGAQFLLNFMDHNGNTPPANWDGVINLESK